MPRAPGRVYGQRAEGIRKKRQMIRLTGTVYPAGSPLSLSRWPPQQRPAGHLYVRPFSQAPQFSTDLPLTEIRVSGLVANSTKLWRPRRALMRPCGKVGNRLSGEGTEGGGTVPAQPDSAQNCLARMLPWDARRCVASGSPLLLRPP